MDYLKQHIESLVFVSEKTISLKDIRRSLEKTFDTKFKDKEITPLIEALIEQYKSPSFSFELVHMANGYTFLTKGIYHKTIASYLQITNKKKLSKSALETLAIIAYKQPVTRIEVDSIRGVSSDYSIHKLLEKELVEIDGRSDAPGRPLIYKTGDKFMNYFGLGSLNDLPKPKDFKSVENEIGSPESIEIDIKNG